MKTTLTIAGSDCSGGAGVQADLKTMTMHNVYAMSVITALTAQNTQGVQAIEEVSNNFVIKQMQSVFTDIYPDAIKIGMVASASLIEDIVDQLIHFKAKNIIVDPVMVATSGAKLVNDDAIKALKNKLFHLSLVITPNIPEAEILSGVKITTASDMEKAAKNIGDTYFCAVLCKGGHQINDANDVLYDKGTFHWFYGDKIHNPNTHGTGCTLSSAIAANIAKGYNLIEAIHLAKDYLSGALLSMLDLGAGSGPLHHSYQLEKD